MDAKLRDEMEGLMKRFFPEAPLTASERELFQFAYNLSHIHCLDYLGENTVIIPKECIVKDEPVN
jgi:hypothetical protein